MFFNKSKPTRAHRLISNEDNYFNFLTAPNPEALGCFIMTLKDLFSRRKKENREEENGIKTNTANSFVKSDEIYYLNVGF